MAKTIAPASLENTETMKDIETANKSGAGDAQPQGDAVYTGKAQVETDLGGGTTRVDF